ncbi:MAG: leucine-rich repeat protein [Eubacterium sp.]|nr:leucine-rich repeat protein [Eubacterium sp.]
MQKGRKVWGIFLALVMMCTMLPDAFYAAAAAGQGVETVEPTESAEVLEDIILKSEQQFLREDSLGQESVTNASKERRNEATAEMKPVETADFRNSEDMVQEAGISTAGFVEDDYTFLTVGDPLSRTGITSEEIFAFQPDVSGWYHVKADSNVQIGMEAACVYFEGGEEKITGFYSWYFSYGEIKDHVFYGRAGDTYLFRIWSADGKAADCTVSVDEGEISRVEVVNGPETVYNSLNFRGMKLKLIYSDGTFTITDVNTYGEIEAFQYSWLNGDHYFGSSLTVEGYDIVQTPITSQSPADLEDGTHTAYAYIRKYENGTSTKIEFTFDFIVERDAVGSLEVLSTKKTTYEDGFEDSFNSLDSELENEVIIQVNYKDGRPLKEISSKTAHTGLYQYLEIGGKKYETVDDYIDNGGSFGKAEVHVSYRGVETTYQITIVETPYRGMDVRLIDNKFYSDCGYVFGNDSSPGEAVSEGNIINQVTLHYKDASKREETYAWYSLPGYWRRGTAGLKLTIDGQTRLYHYIDDYLAAGGTIGEAVYQVNYAGATAEVPVEICENPYSRIEILTPPKRTAYVEGKSYEIVTEGMVIRAYDAKEETKFTDITVPGTTNAVEDRRVIRHLNTRLGGHENTQYLEIGTHNVTVFYYGHSAVYEIEIVDRLISDFEITKEPDHTEFLVGNTGGNWIDRSGMEVTFTLEGKRFEHLRIESSEYYRLCEQYSEWLEIDDSKVNFNKPGTYPVKVSFMGAESEYLVKVLEKMVDSLTILSPPDKTTYYPGETESIYLDGLEISVTGLNSQVTNYKAYVGEDDEYGSWDELSNSYYGWQMDDSEVDFDQPGTYEAAFCYGGVSDTFTIEIIESPVASVEINQMPQKMSYYQFEAERIDLNGLRYTIHYNDGTPDYHGAVVNDSPYIDVDYKSEYYTGKSQWKNTDFYNSAALSDNEIVLSFLGASARISASLLEDPVSKIEVMRNPERMSYPPFGNCMVDLYGAEFKVFYKDGTSEIVSVQEHVSEVITEKFGLLLSSSTSYGDLGSYFYVGIAGINSRVILLEKFDFSEEKFTDTTDDKIQNVNITTSDPYRIFRFVPAETKEYTFFSEGNFNSYGYIYYADGFLLASSGYGGTGDNFSITSRMTAGETYYCVAKMYSFQTEGSFISCISSKRSSFTLNETDVEKFEIIKAPKTQYYTFENIWAHNVPLIGLGYRITCKDKTVLEGCVNENYGENCAYVYGAYINGRFKYVTDDKTLDMTKENAIIYSMGDCTVEVPITFSDNSPVESIVLENNPWSQVMQYEADRALYERRGLVLTVNYTDGTKRTVQDGAEWIYDGYNAYMSFNWKNYDENGMASAGENAIVVTYLGARVEVPVLVRENTVNQIIIVENPEKMTYLPFENEADLYGLRLKAVDEDGTEETVEITAHGSRHKIGNKFGTGTVSAYLAEDEEGSPCVKIDYMNCSAYYYPAMQSSYAQLLGNAAEIAMGQTVSVSLNRNKLYQVYRFTPQATMFYEFSSAGSHDTYMHLIDSNGEVMGSDDDGNSDGNNFKFNGQLEKGTTYYYLVRFFDVGTEGTFTCTLKSGEPEREIAEADVVLNAPAAGEALPGVNEEEGYSAHVSWTNADNETTAEYAKAYRAKIVLTPDEGCVFSKTAQIRLNGRKAVSKTYNSNGTITVYYTFPYTDCQVTVPEIKGYELDESANSRKGQTEYGKSYSFRYQRTDESAEALVVSADGTLLKADENGVYTITEIKSNLSVSARIISEETKNDWTRLNFYDKETLSDSFYAERNHTVAASGEERTLPILESYVNGSDQFFFGWYENQNDSLNGIGKRFRSTSTVPDLDVLPLYAKWGIGMFSCMYNTKTVNYKVLSIDEENRLKVQIVDGSNTAANYARKAFRAAAVNDDVLTIPGSITDLTGTGLDELGIAFGGCEVTAIAEHAFSGNTDIRKISLPDTITEIGAGAFRGCTNLESIEIPGSVEKIESETFRGCENLTDVVLTDGVTSVGENVFEGCSSLHTIVVPDSVRDIDATAFSDSGEDLTIICSSNLTDVVSEAADAVGATVQTVDIAFDYAYADREFTYGGKMFTVTAKLLVDGKEDKERTAALDWQTSEGTRDYYTAAKSVNTMRITPKQVTNGKTYSVTAVDSASGQIKSIALSTIPASLDRVAIVEEIPAAAYTGSAVCPKVKIRMAKSGVPLVEGKDYTVAYWNNIEAGAKAEVKITGIHNFCGEITKYFTIQKGAAKITLSDTKLRMKINASKKLTAVITPSGVNQNVTWTSSNPSVATVSSNGTVKAIANGTAEITAKADGKTAVCQVVVPYTITYKLKGGKNHADNPSDYYKENITLKNPSRSKYIFAGWYTDKKFKKKIKKIKDSATKNYVLYAKWTKISLGKTNVSSAKKSASHKTTIKYKASSKKSKNRKLEIKYRKVKKADGYEVAYSTNKKYKKSSTKTVQSKKNKVTIKLKKGKTYYIRIRAYQIDSTGARIYGKWTSSKTVNVKK